ncbi:MAG TPA: hypothetical protein VHE37_01385, partial [Nevskiaceae bacterium]|nr:hypothetical protein [Nevskiaceae bacterium]
AADEVGEVLRNGHVQCSFVVILIILSTPGVVEAACLPLPPGEVAAQRRVREHGRKVDLVYAEPTPLIWRFAPPSPDGRREAIN